MPLQPNAAVQLAQDLATEVVDAEANSAPLAPATPVRSRAQHLLLAASMVLIGLNLRPESPCNVGGVRIPQAN